jgi:hypothetical protein
VIVLVALGVAVVVVVVAALVALVLFGLAVLSGDQASAQVPGVPSELAVADIPAELLPVYQQAAQRTCDMSWTVLAAVGKVETDHGRSRLAGVQSGANFAGARAPCSSSPARGPPTGSTATVTE